MKTLYFLVIILFNSNLIAQSVSVKWVEADENKMEFIKPNYAFTRNNGNIVVVSYEEHKKAGNQKVTITEFDSKLKRLKSSFDSKWTNTSNEELEIKQCLRIKATYYLIGSYYDKKLDKFNYSAIEIGEDLKQKGKAISLANINVDAKRKIPKIIIEYSPDSSVILLYADLFSKKKEQDEYFFKAFDDQLKPLWEKNKGMPYISKEMRFQNCKVSNAGDAYIQYYRIVKKEAENYVMILTNNGKKENTIAIDHEGKYIGQYKSIVNSNGNITYVGVYSNKKNRERYHGMCYFTLDVNAQKIINGKFMEFDQELLSQFYKSKTASRLAKNDRGIDNDYELIDIFPKSDGGFVAFFEETDISKSGGGMEYGYNTMSGDWGFTSSGSSSTIVNKKDIVLAHFNQENKLTTMDPIYKHLRIKYKERVMVFNGGQYLSDYLNRFIKNQYFFYDDNLFNIFVDHPKNEVDGRFKIKKKIKKCTNLKKADGILSWVVDGVIKRKKILNGKEEKLILNAQLSRQLAPNKILLYASGFMKNKKEKLGLLTLDGDEPMIKEIPMLVNTQGKSIEKEKSNENNAESIPPPQESNLGQTNKGEAIYSMYSTKSKGIMPPAIPTDNIYKGKSFFTVEVLTSSVKINAQNEILEHFPNHVMTYENGLYHYTVGQFESSEQANKFLTYIEHNGYLGYLVEYENGIRK